MSTTRAKTLLRFDVYFNFKNDRRVIHDFYATSEAAAKVDYLTRINDSHYVGHRNESEGDDVYLERHHPNK